MTLLCLELPHAHYQIGDFGKDNATCITQPNTLQCQTIDFILDAAMWKLLNVSITIKIYYDTLSEIYSKNVLNFEYSKLRDIKVLNLIGENDLLIKDLVWNKDGCSSADQELKSIIIKNIQLCNAKFLMNCINIT